MVDFLILHIGNVIKGIFQIKEIQAMSQYYFLELGL